MENQKVNTSEETVFNLETESETLQNNIEYQLLLKTLHKLQQQRVQAVERLEKLYDLRDILVTNPRPLINALENGEDLNIPAPIEVTELPDLEWSKYNVEDMITDIRPVTRKKNSSVLNSKQAVNLKKDLDDNGEKPNLVRGRVFDDDKSKTFNRQWTIEEQKKLEELLIKYPQERISTRRFAKIAKELGSYSGTSNYIYHHHLVRLSKSVRWQSLDHFSPSNPVLCYIVS